MWRGPRKLVNLFHVKQFTAARLVNLFHVKHFNVRVNLFHVKHPKVPQILLTCFT